MFPFTNPVKWLLSSRFQHLVEVIKTLEAGLQGDLLRRIRRRRRGLERWGRVRIFVLTLLYFGVLVSLLGWMVQLLPILRGPAEELLRTTAAWTSAAAGLLAVLYFGISRLLGQLEIDVLTLLLIRHEELLQDLQARS